MDASMGCLGWDQSLNSTSHFKKCFLDYGKSQQRAPRCFIDDVSSRDQHLSSMSGYKLSFGSNVRGDEQNDGSASLVETASFWDNRCGV